MRRLGVFFVTVLAAFALAVPGSTAVPSESYLVVDIVRFIGPDCSAAVIDISNQGDALQPFGWTLTLEVPKLKISETFAGQQPLAPGEISETIIATGISAAGTYHVKFSAGEVAGKEKSGHSTLHLPSTC